MKKAILFDLDNTLYDYNKPHEKALKEVYKVLKQHINISFKKFIKLFNISKAEIHKELAGTASAHNRILYFQRLIEKTHNTVEPKIILKLYSAYWNTFLKNMKIRKDVLNTLKKIRKKGLKIIIVTDLTTHIQLRKIEKLKISNYIDFLVTSEEAGSEKPHSIMFLLALNKIKILPKDAVMVGDNTITDIEGANSVGLDTVLLQNKKTIKRY
ncbi:HAD-IA family hydrolase, partial [Candidatus Woesearchaeota archaeon]|nr:HAD-IA family hydrolase [Candidatus Woesearchaeota archaeon]